MDHEGIYEVRTTSGDVIIGVISFNTETNETVIKATLEGYKIGKDGTKHLGKFKQDVTCTLPLNVKAYNTKTGLPILRRDETIQKVLEGNG